MNRRARFLLLVPAVIAVSLLAGPASANTASLKCNSHRDQIWVYNSLNTFDVEAKLKCGEDVEIVGRVRDYVKIRAQNGLEGYVRRMTSLICHLRQFARTRLMTSG